MALSRKDPVEFTVEGRLPFPIDMLRYDSCWPADPESAAQIHASIVGRRGADKDRWVVKLRTHSPVVTSGRWGSFNWQVTYASPSITTR